MKNCARPRLGCSHFLLVFGNFGAAFVLDSPTGKCLPFCDVAKIRQLPVGSQGGFKPQLSSTKTKGWFVCAVGMSIRTLTHEQLHAGIAGLWHSRCPAL